MPDSAGSPSALNPVPFTAGESLLWETREGNQLIRRQVGFQRLEHGRAVVAWGLTSEGEPSLFTADPSELRRPVPPAPPARIEPPAPPSPEPLSARREKLRRANDAWFEAEALARQADQLVHRARQVFVEAELDLQRCFGDLEERAEAAAIDRIRAGCTDPVVDVAAAEWGERETARRRRDASRAALHRLEAESFEASAREREADKARRLAAKYVLEGLARGFVDALAAMEAEVAQRRAEATALALVWIEGGPLQLGEDADRIITAGPAQIVDPIGLRQELVEQRQMPWQALFDRLLIDAEADFDPYLPNDRRWPRR